VFVFDRDLHPLATLHLNAEPVYPSPCPPAVRVSAHTSRAYVLFGGANSFFPIPMRLLAIDLAAGQLVGDVEVSSTLGHACSTLNLLTAPGPPRNFLASVDGQRVSLVWENVGGASHFVLEVGLAPGRTDLSVALGPDSRASFANVPSGTYYLRLRGGNEFGGGRPSSEIRVAVP